MESWWPRDEPDFLDPIPSPVVTREVLPDRISHYELSQP